MAEDPDAIYYCDAAEQLRLMEDQPWTRDPRHRYFRRARISRLALMKMTTHASSDLDVPVIGITLGKVDGDSFVVMDAFSLCNDGACPAVSELVWELVDRARVSADGRMEKQLGYYHSQPGRGRWLPLTILTNIMDCQETLDPCFTLVMDPIRILSSGEVDIGAYRAYPLGYTPLDETESVFFDVPNDDRYFGLHCKKYYSLDISYFESSLGSHLLNPLRGNTWIRTLSSCQLARNKEDIAERISDLAERLEDMDLKMTFSSPEAQQQKEDNNRLRMLSQDTSKIIQGQVRVLWSTLIKNSLFESADQLMEAHLVPQESADPEDE